MLHMRARLIQEGKNIISDRRTCKRTAMTYGDTITTGCDMSWPCMLS